MSTNFNPRSREGSDSLAVVQVIISALISIHAPARGATLLDRKSIDFRQNFNPRSREGSDFLLSVLIVQFRISIHAPARGATHRIQLVIRISIISIHAPARGATRVRLVCCRRLAISIHAPARGATAPAQTVKSYTVDFNPRSREGSDRNSAICDNSDSLFQSTLPRGERPGLAWFLFPFRAFQSTLPRGERPRSPRSMICAMISIHAPARGATQSQHRPTAERLDFNPRSREGSDDVLYYSGTVYNYISIHAPARGAT